MPLLPLLIFLLIVWPITIASLWTFDRLVGIEFREFPDKWRADGRPCPLLWPREDMPMTFRSKLAASWCGFVWLFLPPAWSEGHAEASRCLHRLRVLGVLGMVALPLFGLSGLVAALCAAGR